MDQIQAIRAFLAISEGGSFVSAARALRISPASATRAVAWLEADLGIPLLTRTTRAVRLTEQGALYAERTRSILTQIDDARGAARGEGASPHGTLRITAPILFGRLHVLPAVEALASAHPALVVRLTFLDRVVNLVEEGFDAAVRIGAMVDSALTAVRLTEVSRVLVASPAYLDSCGAPSDPASLRHHRIISFDGVGSTDDWRFGAEEKAVVKVTPRIAVNCADSAIDAAARGGGIARLLSYQVASAIAAGRLRLVLAEHQPPPIPVSLVYPADRRRSANLRHFKQEMRAAIRLIKAL